MAGRPHTSRAPRRPGAPRTAAPGFAADSSRAFIPLVVFAVVAALFLVRLVYLQVIVAPSYAAQAEQARTVGFDIEPRRGTIYDLSLIHILLGHRPRAPDLRSLQHVLVEHRAHARFRHAKPCCGLFRAEHSSLPSEANRFLFTVNYIVYDIINGERARKNTSGGFSSAGRDTWLL